MGRNFAGRKEHFLARVAIARLAVGTSSPGDGMTRYRFFRQSGMKVPGPVESYYGDKDIYTACGLTEACDFLSAYIAGMESREEPDWSRARIVGKVNA